MEPLRQTQSPITVFDRVLLRRRRDRAAAGFISHAALVEEGAVMLTDRLGDVKRAFTSVLDLGAHKGVLTRQLAARYPQAFTVVADLSLAMLRDAPGASIVADEEFLPFAPESFDLITSNLSLHWANDLPGALVQIRNALKAGGLFLATLIGGESLVELRSCLLDAELAVTGGISPRVSPSIDLPTATALMQRAGFALPVTDQEQVTFTYPDAFALMRDLRGMGAANAHSRRLKAPTRKAVLDLAAAAYRERHGDSSGRISASFDIIFLHGWKN